MNIFWLLRGGGSVFGKWQVMVDVFWLVVGGGASWYVIAGGGGYILAGVGQW